MNFAFFESLRDSIDQAFRPPASAETWDTVTTETGLDFPKELKALYAWADGEDAYVGTFMGMPWIPLEEGLRQWRVWRSIDGDDVGGTYTSTPAHAVRYEYTNRGWWPIAHDSSGNHIGIDLSPGPKGVSGQVINFGRDQDDKYVLAHDLGSLLDYLLQEWQAGRLRVEGEDEDRYMVHELGVSLIDGGPALLPLPLKAGAVVVHEDRSADIEALNAYTGPWAEIIGNPEEFLKSRTLYAMRKGLDHVEPLRYCKDLKSVYLAANSITDLSPLIGLDNLEVVHVYRNPLSDLTPLAQLPNLRVLHLGGSKVTSLEFLQNLSFLQVLEMEDLAVDSLQPLGQAKDLRTLTLSDSGERLSQLAECRKLNSLTLKAAKEGAAFLGLPELTALTHLSLKGWSVRDGSVFAHLPNLEKLELSDCVVGSFESMGAAKLRSITLNETKVESFDALAAMPSLQTFEGMFEHFEVMSALRPDLDFSSILGNMTDEQQERWFAFLG